MNRRFIVLLAAVLAAWPATSRAASYRCALKQGAGERKKEIWAGTIELKDKPATAGEVLIIKKDGSAISLDELVSRAQGPVQDALRPYDGFLVLGLRRSAGTLDVNIGRVDASAQKDMAPMQVDGWTSAGAKEVGLVDIRTGLWALCKRK